MGAALLAVAFGLFAGLAQAQEGRITVVGRAEATAVPDMARITLGVTREAETAQAAMAAMSEDMRAVLTAIEAAGIVGRDVQTGALRLQPVQSYDRETGVATVTGYRAVTDVDVAVRVLEDLGPVLDAVVGTGATQVSGLQFDVADRSSLLDAARRDAVAQARAKAELYAEAAGVSLGALLELSEAGNAAPPQPMMRMAMDEMASGPPIAAGELTIGADVLITWAVAE